VFARLQETVLQANDILLLQADTASLERAIEADWLELVQRGPQEAQSGADLALVEAVVLPNAIVQGSSPSSLDLRQRYGVSLVAAARQGRRFEGRLRDATLRAGDVLLLEGEPARLRATIADLGCLPLARSQAGTRTAPHRRAAPPVRRRDRARGIGAAAGRGGVYLRGAGHGPDRSDPSVAAVWQHRMVVVLLGAMIPPSSRHRPPRRARSRPLAPPPSITW
jgi:TrkA-C domain